MTRRTGSRVSLLLRALATAGLAAAVVLGLAPPSLAVTYAPLSGSGSTASFPAIHSWINSLTPSGLSVSYAPDGSAGGLADFAQGTVNWAASDFPYGTPGISEPPPARGYAYVPDTASATALMYNLTINEQQVTNLRLSGATIAGIFTGAITMWNNSAIEADNPGLTMPATRITPVVRTDPSPETLTFTQWMAATQSSSWNAYCLAVGRSPCTPAVGYPVAAGSAFVPMVGDPGVETYVSQPASNGAIGYTSNFMALAAGFPVAKVLNAAGYYTAPTPGNVGVSLLAATPDLNQGDPLYGSENLSQVYTDSDPRTYELSSYSYMIVPTDLSSGMTADKGYALGVFGQYLLCQGQQQLDVLGDAALPENLVEAGFTQLAKVPGAVLPATAAAFLQGCANPTFTPDGTDTLLLTTPLPTQCDKQNVVCGTIPIGVGQVATTTSLVASPSPGTAGQLFTLVAGVAPASGHVAPAGTVQFLVGGTLLGGPVTVDANGVATTTTTFAAAGTESLAAAFVPADPSAFAASTGTFSLTVNPSQTSGGIPVTVTDPPVGAFTLTVDSADPVALAVSGSSATAATTPVVVSDTRNTYPGWAVSGQSTDFTGSGTAAGAAIAGNQLGWTPTASALASGVFLGGPVAPAAPGLGSSPALLAIAPAGHGFGTTTLGANLTLAIPAPAENGPYTASLSVTAVASAA